MSQPPTAPAESPAESAGSPFASLAEFVALPRLGALALSSDGSRLAVSVHTLDAEKKKWQSALWEVDPAGRRPARRLTRSAPGESSPVWSPDGSLLFTSARPDPAAPEQNGEPKPALWSLPADGGEARLVLSRPGGIAAVAVAADSGDVVVGAATMRGGSDARDRRGAADQAEGRRGDGDPARELPDPALGPRPRARVPHLFWAGQLPAEEPPTGSGRRRAAGPHPGGGTSLRCRRRHRAVPRRAATSPGPRRWPTARQDGGRGSSSPRPAAGSPACSWTTRWPTSTGRGSRRTASTLVCVRETLSTYEEPPDYTLLLVDVAGGAVSELTPDFDRWPSAPQFSADGSAVYFLADDDGRHAVFRVPVAGGEPVRLTGDGAYSDLSVARDGSALYALRSGYDSPSVPVRLDPEAPLQEPTALPNPGTLTGLPGTLHEVEATAADGSRVQSWLVLPEGASADSPAPLLLWVHGGPLMSWNSWSWRWCPWVMAARGYAVLLPNPALSQGFGQDFVRRGWGEWGGAPYTDLMAAVDAAEAAAGHRRAPAPRRWAARSAATWPTGSPPRPTGSARSSPTPACGTSTRSPAPPMRPTSGRRSWATRCASPSATSRTRRTATPTPSARRCWSSTATRTTACRSARGCGSGTTCRSAGCPSKFLYFPDENHWVLTPGNSIGLVRDRAGLPGRARAGRGVAAARAALTGAGRPASARPARHPGPAARPRCIARSSAGGTQPASAWRAAAGRGGRSGSLSSARSSATLAMAPSPRSQALTASRVAGAASSGAGARRVHSVHSDLRGGRVRARSPARGPGRGRRGRAAPTHPGDLAVGQPRPGAPGRHRAAAAVTADHDSSATASNPTSRTRAGTRPPPGRRPPPCPRAGADRAGDPADQVARGRRSTTTPVATEAASRVRHARRAAGVPAPGAQHGRGQS